MNDREKVIQAMDCCLDIIRSGRWGSGCAFCPYVEMNKCREQMIIDAIELLKEQKAVEQKHYEATRYNGELYACSDCFHELETVKPRFCSFCGKPILWEDGTRK